MCSWIAKAGIGEGCGMGPSLAPSGMYKHRGRKLFGQIAGQADTLPKKASADRPHDLPIAQPIRTISMLLPPGAQEAHA